MGSSNNNIMIQYDNYDHYTMISGHVCRESLNLSVGFKSFRIQIRINFAARLYLLYSLVTTPNEVQPLITSRVYYWTL